ncbi:MAG TPA: hypothetical protein VLD61_05425, partial [Methylomirabilota bacterium]|nr:hypothetical protein [Methylomirabilota bacterium]
MHRRTVLGLGVGMAATAAGWGFERPAAAQAPPFATRKVADNVYVFRYQFHQSMFVVTPAGVIATDPIGYLRPAAVTTYLDEIRKVSTAPIRYL